MGFVRVSWRTLSKVIDDWEEVVTLLRVVDVEGGIINLSSGKNTLSLQMDAGQGLYLPIISITKKGCLRFYHTAGMEMRRVYFDGDSEYDALLTDDFDLILKLAKEFYDTGDVKRMVPEKDLPPEVDEG